VPREAPPLIGAYDPCIEIVPKKAEAEMELLTAERRRLPRVIDVPSLVEVYQRWAYHSDPFNA